MTKAPNRLWKPSSFSSLPSPRSTDMLPMLQTHSDLYFSIVHLPNDLWAFIHCCPLDLEILHSSFRKKTAHSMTDLPVTLLLEGGHSFSALSLNICLISSLILQEQLLGTSVGHLGPATLHP